MIQDRMHDYDVSWASGWTILFQSILHIQVRFKNHSGCRAINHWDDLDVIWLKSEQSAVTTSRFCGWLTYWLTPVLYGIPHCLQVVMRPTLENSARQFNQARSTWNHGLLWIWSFESSLACRKDCLRILDVAKSLDEQALLVDQLIYRIMQTTIPFWY